LLYGELFGARVGRKSGIMCQGNSAILESNLVPD